MQIIYYLSFLLLENNSQNFVFALSLSLSLIILHRKNFIVWLAIDSIASLHWRDSHKGCECCHRSCPPVAITWKIHYHPFAITPAQTFSNTFVQRRIQKSKCELYIRKMISSNGTSFFYLFIELQFHSQFHLFRFLIFI